MYHHKFKTFIATLTGQEGCYLLLKVGSFEWGFFLKKFISFLFFRVQVRRTDKINTEAAFHSIEEYMYWVDLFYNKLERVQPVKQRRVYLATDDANLLPEAKEK